MPWQTIGNDILLLGADKAPSFDFEEMETRLSRPQVSEDLRRIKIERLTTLLSLQMQDDTAIRTVAGNGPLNRDLYPRLEYQAPKAFFLAKNTRLLFDRDMRRDPDWAKSLVWGSYLSHRGKGLTAEEYRELGRFHEDSPGPYLVGLMRQWRGRFPADPEASFHLARALFQVGEDKAAWSILGPLTGKHCSDPECLDLAADLAPEPGNKVALLKRLLATGSKELHPPAIYRRMALALEKRDYPEALSYFGKAAAAAIEKGNRSEAAGYWMEAALLAIKRADISTAGACAQEALKLDPADPGARSVVQKIARLEGAARTEPGLRR